MTDGTRRLIAPHQIADPSIARPDWPRADLNIACLELLIGLVLLADPPADLKDWRARRSPDPQRLAGRLAPFAPAFELTGEGPRFMQDAERIEGEANPPDMLFIDSAGGNTARNNADLMVWRDRYRALDPALAAIALYAFQSFAPSGGKGNRTSMRGGGPMVTLIDPGQGLWELIWANVPRGRPGTIDALPWMRPTVTSERGEQVFPEQRDRVEAFFGMPRRLRLIEEGGAITGVIQRPYGNNYAGWDHPLTPYYRPRLTDDWLPRHPRAGLFGYRNWLGVVSAAPSEAEGLQRRAQVVRDWHERGGGADARVVVAGWSMDNMKPRDFILSTPPLVDLDLEGQIVLAGLVEAADLMSQALRFALAPVLAEGEAREAVREAFYAETQAAFEAHVTALQAGRASADIAQGWLGEMRQVAMRLFESRALPGLADRDIDAQARIVAAHRQLAAALHGRGKLGRKAFAAMMLPIPGADKEAA